MTETERLTAELEKTAIPEYMRASAIGYLTGEQPYVGSFLDALLKNDLKRTVIRAAPGNAAVLKDWVRFLFDTAPHTCWGSPEKVRDWQLACTRDLAAGALDNRELIDAKELLAGRRSAP